MRMSNLASPSPQGLRDRVSATSIRVEYSGWKVGFCNKSNLNVCYTPFYRPDYCHSRVHGV